MSLPLDFHPEVEGEVNEAYEWYENSQPGVGDNFAAAVDKALAAILAQPAGYAMVHRDVRQFVMAQFPFAIYYRVLRNRIRVTAVYHASRDPSGWQSRR